MQLRAIALGTAAALAATVTLAGCSDDSEKLIIYSGREEELVDPLLDQLEDEVGVDVEVRYADTADLAAQLLEEGDSTEADLFFSQDAGALGALADEGMLTTLDPQDLNKVDRQYRDSEGKWLATSARARVIAYDPAAAPEVAEMDSVKDIIDDKYQGEIGIPPTNASFQAFVTAMRVMWGEDEARKWLEDLMALDPQIYDNNIDTLAAIENGEISLGLINHYYWFQDAAEVGEENMNSRLHYLSSNDPGALINIAGVGIIKGTNQAPAAKKAVDFLLSEQAQTYFAEETAEYPILTGVSTAEHDLRPVSQLRGPDMDLNDLESLDKTLKMLEEVGLA